MADATNLALPLLEDEWRLSDTELGLISSVFVVVSALATIPAGWVADHYRRTRVIGWTLFSWSGLILLSATAVNYVNLLVARAAMGIGQAVDDPASTSYLGDSYPARILLLLRARHTLEDDARAIVTAIYEENQLLEKERAAMVDAAAEAEVG